MFLNQLFKMKLWITALDLMTLNSARSNFGLSMVGLYRIVSRAVEKPGFSLLKLQYVFFESLP